MRFRSAGRAADAITAGTPAQQDDLVTGGRGFTADMVGRGRAYDGADFHALGHIARMVDFIDLTGRQTDLVAVRGVSSGCSGDDLTLGELALECFGNRDARVAGAGHAHRLIHIGAARQRVADASADAGGCAAERFDFGRMVVGFVLEQEQPILVLAVHIDLHFNGAGVDFLGFVQVLENAVLLKPLGTDRAHIHEAYRLAVAPELMAHGQILVERGLDHGVIDIDFVKLRAEGGVTAVVGPVGVDHLDLGDGRFAVFTVEILLAYFRIRQIHRETALVDEPLEAFVVQLVESGDDLDLRRLGDLHFECVLRFQGGFAGFDRVDYVLFDLLDGLLVQIALQRVDLGAAHSRAFALADQLDAFARRIGALVELSGQEFDSEHGTTAEIRHIHAGVVHLRFAEHGCDGLIEQVLADIFDIVPVDDTQTGQPRDAKDRFQFVLQLPGLDVKALLLLDINAKNHGIPSVVGISVVWWFWLPRACWPDAACTKQNGPHRKTGAGPDSLGVLDAFSFGQLRQTAVNFLISGDDVAQIAAEQILVKMLDFAAMILQIPQTAGVGRNLVGQQNRAVGGLAFLDLEIDELHVDLGEDVLERLVDGTRLTGDLRELVLRSQTKGDDAVIVDERITQIVGLQAEFEDRLLQRRAFLDAIPFGEGAGGGVAHDDLQRVHGHLAHQLFGVRQTLDEVAVDAASLEQFENHGGDVVVQATLAGDLRLLRAVAGRRLVHVFDPQDVGIVGRIHFFGLALIELFQFLHDSPSS